MVKLLEITNCRFQSHAGSIEAEPILLEDAAALRFQSHAGSIEAAPRRGEAMEKQCGFNPTLVRLRPITRRSADGFTCCFNPTLVRLRPLRSPPTSPSASQFQSHAGSIEARIMTALHGLRLWVCFNPTLVRLRRQRLVDPAHLLRRFQSHAGSIEAGGGGTRMGGDPLVSIPRWFD